MRSAAVWVVAGLLLVAAGDEPPANTLSAVTIEGVVLWPAATEEIRNRIARCEWPGMTTVPDETGFVEVIVPSDGKIHCGGHSVTLPALRERLRRHAERKRDTDHPRHPSLVPVLVRAAKDAPWAAVQSVFLCATMPDVRMPRIYLSLAGRKGTPVIVPCFQPLDPARVSLRKTVTTADVEIIRGPREAYSRFILGGSYEGSGLSSLNGFTERLVKVAGHPVVKAAEIHAWPDVPFSEVMYIFRFLSWRKGRSVIFLAPTMPPGLEDGPADALPPVASPEGVVWPGAPEEIRKQVVVPTWIPAARPARETDFVEVVVTADRTVYCGGRIVTWRALERRLTTHARRRRRLDHPMRPSLVPLLIRAPKEVRWLTVQWIRQRATSPDVRMYRIYFALQDTLGLPVWIPAFLPPNLEFHAPRDRLGPVPVVALELKRKRGEATSRVKLLERELGEGDAALALASDMIARIATKNADVTGAINGWAWAPFGEVTKVLGLFRTAGIRTVSFAGAPSPGKDYDEEGPVARLLGPARDMDCLAPTRRGKLTVWPAMKPADRANVPAATWSGSSPAPAESELVEIVIDRKGRPHIGGRAVDLPGLAKRLRAHLDRKRDGTGCVLRVSRDVGWGPVKAVMATCAGVGIRRVYLAAWLTPGWRSEPVYVPVPLPADRGAMAGRTRFLIGLTQRAGETGPRVTFNGEEVGRGAEGFEMLEERAFRPEKDRGGFYAEIAAGATVPFQQVLSALESLRLAGVDPVLLLET